MKKTWEQPYFFNFFGEKLKKLKFSTRYNYNGEHKKKPRSVRGFLNTILVEF